MPLLAVGGRFPEQSLPDLEGRPRPLAETWAAGQALLIVGHADCETTRLALPYVDRIHTGRPAGTTVLAVLQEDPEGARALRKRLGLAMPALLDLAPHAFGPALGLETVPTLLHVDRSGHVVAVVEGFRRDALEALAVAVGAPSPFTKDDPAPALRPG